MRARIRQGLAGDAHGIEVELVLTPATTEEREKLVLWGAAVPRFGVAMRESQGTFRLQTEIPFAGRGMRK